MRNLAEAPGVIKRATRLFITSEDVMAIFECCKSSSYKILDEVNKYAVKKGQRPYIAGKANKYLFSELYGLPLEEIDRVING